jgi:hypothetical protein
MPISNYSKYEVQFEHKLFRPIIARDLNLGLNFAVLDSRYAAFIG